MLTQLRITNFALLSEIQIDFPKDLSLLTGETGAGKSILIDAICRLLGARATQDDVRAGASRAVLEAIFDARKIPDAARQLLQNWSIDLEEEDLIVRREIQTGGKSRSVINHCSVTLSQLKELAPHLIDVFGQNEHQTLLDSQSQRALYDSSCGIEDRIAELGRIAREIQELQREHSAIMEREQQRQRNIDMLQYQIREIEDANMDEAEEQELHAKKLIQQNSEKIHSLCDSLLQEILESDENLLGKIETIGKQLSELKDYQETFSNYVSRCMEWLDEMNELCRKVDTMRQGIDFEESSLNAIEERLDLLQKLKKKYGSSIAEVLQHLARCKQELNSNFQSEWRAEQIVAAVQKAAARYEQLAAEITKARSEASARFSQKVESELKQVAMEKCRFRVALEPSSTEAPSDPMIRAFPLFGRETVAFQIEPNPGEGFRDLSRVASGGELSRLMLALKVVSQNRAGQCLIFDEIDAGIGGRAAYQVGERLKRLSRKAQVICVTHLPQVAAFGDHHFKVSKKVKSDRTTTIVEELPEEEKVRELARMISGSEVTDTALQHAKELREQVEAAVR